MKQINIIIIITIAIVKYGKETLYCLHESELTKNNIEPFFGS